MEDHKGKDMRKAVRESYGKIAKGNNVDRGCCGGASRDTDKVSNSVGYSSEDILNSPKGANIGLVCGNPQPIAEIKGGETVVDLGSGAGFDSFLAEKQVGPRGQVIGVDGSLFS